MKWWRITVEIAEEQLDACAWLLAEALDQPVEIQDKDTLDLASASPMLVISCEVQPSAQQLAAIREVLAQLGQFDVPIEVQSREDKAWLEAWKSFFHTQIISPRFAVRPPWEPSIDHPHNIVIEPGMAFGTGTHPTTAGCLDMLDDVLGDAEAIRILDVGCGSGILAIAAALLGHHVVAIDNDPEAMTNAERNGELNRVSKHIEFFHMSPADLTDTYDLVVANIIAPVLIEEAEAIMQRCANRLILSGLLTKQESAIRDVYGAMKCTHRKTRGDWVFLSLERL